MPAPEGPTIATVWPLGTRKIRSWRIGALGIIGEGDVLENDLALADAQRLAPGRSLISAFDREQAEHLLDIDEALLDLAIGPSR